MTNFNQMLLRIEELSDALKEEKVNKDRQIQELSDALKYEKDKIKK